MKRLEKTEIFTLIEDGVLPVFKEYQKTRSVTHITAEDSKILKKIWGQINPTSYYNGGCSSCVKTVLDNIQSWYQREHTRYIIEHPAISKPVEENIIPVPDVPVKETPIKKKPGRPKKKK